MLLSLPLRPRLERLLLALSVKKWDTTIEFVGQYQAWFALSAV